jgi:hypothetical protein
MIDYQDQGYLISRQEPVYLFDTIGQIISSVPILRDYRMKADGKENNQYSILKDKGAKLSFEKEYYDIVRAGMLKWSYVLLTYSSAQDNS